jgi:hypothetical protein
LIEGERENGRLTIVCFIGTDRQAVGDRDRPRALLRKVTAPLTKNIRTLLAKIERRGNPEQGSICVRMRWHLRNHRDDIEICTGKLQCYKYCMYGISSLRTDCPHI